MVGTHEFSHPVTLFVLVDQNPCCRELERSSGFKSLHKSKQAQRLISRKTVEGVARQLREVLKAGSSLGSPLPSRSG